METITATVGSLRTFPGPRGIWCILEASNPPGTKLTGVVSKEPLVGDTFEFQGSWDSHPKYGKQFKFSNYSLREPRDIKGLRDYLARHIDGIGPHIAEAIVKAFGEKSIQVIEETPAALTSVKGITTAGAERIRESYLRVKENREVDMFFAKNGITKRMQARILTDMADEFSTSSILSVIQKNPYLLSEKVDGIGFLKSDQIANGVGIPRNAPIRIRAGAIYTLKDAASSGGHCYLPAPELLSSASKILSIEGNADILTKEIKHLVDSGRLIHDEGRFYLPKHFNAEKEIAKRLAFLLEADRKVVEADGQVTEGLDDDQARAVELALEENILIITGGPGVGKTHTVKKIIQALSPAGSIALAAPTGKAARRMSEATGKPASTIHRLLKYRPYDDEGGGAFEHNDGNPLPNATVIIDEFSMVDLPLMLSLIKALRFGTRLVMVGDKDQLPSVGPGAILGDMIESGKIPVAYLRTLHRQAAKSLININAKRINEGKKPTYDPVEPELDPDMWFVPEEDPKILKEKLAVICEKVPKNCKWVDDDNCERPFALEDVQVLCPQKRGPVGTFEMNNYLRDRVFNPHGAPIKGTIFRENDRVIQIKNNYTYGIFNGDIGTILEAGYSEDGDECLKIAFDFMDGRRVIDYGYKFIDDLAMAYALTIHKSQGSEWPVVVIPVHTTNYIMLKRNLLYTAVTRGKKMVCLAGTEKAVGIAVTTPDGRTRFTGLADALAQEAENARAKG